MHDCLMCMECGARGGREHKPGCPMIPILAAIPKDIEERRKYYLTHDYLGRKIDVPQTA